MFVLLDFRMCFVFIVNVIKKNWRERELKWREEYSVGGQWMGKEAGDRETGLWGQ